MLRKSKFVHPFVETEAGICFVDVGNVVDEWTEGCGWRMDVVNDTMRDFF